MRRSYLDAATAYALAGGASPYMAADPYLQQQGLYAAAGSPYSHVLYVPTTAGYSAAGMSPQAMSMPGAAGLGNVAGMRSPGQGYGQPGMALSPQLAGGFGGAGFGGSYPGSSSGGQDVRSPVASAGGFGGQQGFGGDPRSSSGLGLREGGGGRGSGNGGDLRGDDRSGGFGGFGGGGSLLYSSGGQQSGGGPGGAPY